MFGTLIEERFLFSGPVIRLFRTDDGVLHEVWISDKGVELCTSFREKVKQQVFI
jgi:hypothetical protein